MQPTNDHPLEPSRNRLRRYGPITGVLVVLALVAGASVVVDDEDGADEATSGNPDDVPTELPDGVVTWPMAQDQGLDVQFPDTCDQDDGRVAVPFFFRTECIADVDDNGGATWSGVTEDEITVVAWLPNDDDVVYSFIKQALGSDDSPDDMRTTQEGLAEVFQAYYQTYGREVRVEFVQASGQMTDSVAARADAVRAAEMEPFAVLGGPLSANTWTQELKARGIPCFFCPGVNDPDGLAYGLAPQNSQIRLQTVNYVANKLAGQPVEYAGDDLVGDERVFGLLKLAVNEGDVENADELVADFEDEGLEIAATSTFELNLGATQESATAAVSTMMDAGVTTVLVDADPINLQAITREATQQGWFPEWVITAGTFLDTSIGGRLQDPEQWEHAFGISYLPPASSPEISPAYQLYEWYHGEPPPGEDSLLLTYPQIALFFTALGFAGPNLTPDTLRQGMFAYPPTPRALTQPSVDYGIEVYGEDRPDDYGGIDDFVEIWWDPEAEGTDEFGNPQQGFYRYVDGGRRYYFDEWPDELRVFDPEGAVTQVTDPPPEEVPPDYPSPAGG
ncbi:MAG: hypothetical protein ACRD2C_04950 [Acidimicrobiales bacterium]